MSTPHDVDSFEQVQKKEHEEIRLRRERAGLVNPGSSRERKLAIEAVGLALSGGGVRAATFDVGLIQGLHETGLLRRIDLQSTVSGGGYAGAALSAAMLEEHAALRTDPPWSPVVSPVDGPGPAGPAGAAGTRSEPDGDAICRDFHDQFEAPAAPAPPRKSPGHGKNGVKKNGAAAPTKPQKSPTRFPLQPLEGGRQPPRVLRMIESGSYMIRVVEFANRWVVGFVLVGLVSGCGAVAAAAAAAWLFRWLDHSSVSDTLNIFGIRGDLLHYMSPAALLIALWLLSWLPRLLFPRAERADGVSSVPSRALLVLALAMVAVGGTAVLATGDVSLDYRRDLWNIPIEGSKADVAWWVTLLRSALPTVLGMALVPFLTPTLLIRSGYRPKKIWHGWIFEITTRALLLGVPLFFFANLAAENLSGFNEDRTRDAAHLGRPTWTSEPESGVALPARFDLRPCDFRDWFSFWSEVHLQADYPTTMLLPGQQNPSDARRRISRRLYDAANGTSWGGAPAVASRVGGGPGSVASRASGPAGPKPPSLDVLRSVALRFVNAHLPFRLNLARSAGDEPTTEIEGLLRDEERNREKDRKTWPWQRLPEAFTLIERRRELQERLEEVYARMTDEVIKKPGFFGDLTTKDLVPPARLTEAEGKAWTARLGELLRRTDELKRQADLPQRLVAIEPAEAKAAEDMGLKAEPDGSYRLTYRRWWQLRGVQLDRLDKALRPRPIHEDERDGAAACLRWLYAFDRSGLPDLEWSISENNWDLLTHIYDDDFQPKSTVFAYIVQPADQSRRLLILAVALVGFLALGLTVNMNQVSLFPYYRRRLEEMWIREASQRDHTIPLADLNAADHGAPYPLIHATLKPPSGREPATPPKDVFLFSKHACGCERLGFVPASRFADGDYDMASAIAVSGAALSPSYFRNPLLSWMMLLLNLRLGQWLPNPSFDGRNVKMLSWIQSKTRATPLGVLWGTLRCLWIRTFLREVQPRDVAFIYVADGGFIENLGLEALLLRRCKVILVSDADNDHEYKFGSLTRVLRRVRRNNGIEVTPWTDSLAGSAEPVTRKTVEGLMGLMPTEWPENLLPNRKTGGKDDESGDSKEGKYYSNRHTFLGLIHYPAIDETRGPETGLLIYVTPVFTDDEPADLLRYWVENPDFPHDTTLDQDFDPEQFEAYRLLGQHVGLAVGRELFESFRDWTPPTDPTADPLGRMLRGWLDQKKGRGEKKAEARAAAANGKG